jgi:AcrR family transcriptional regulator
MAADVRGEDMDVPMNAERNSRNADAGESSAIDLTSRARIRNAGLHQFATTGFAGTPLRAIASEAGVAIGLISHHFGSKDGLRAAVESWIVDQFAAAITEADAAAPDSVADTAGRDAAVAQMLKANPLIVGYLRRELLEGSAGRTLITRLARLSLQSVDSMRSGGVASTDRSRVDQVVTVMIRQLGKLFLQPLVDQVVDSFSADERPAAKPELTITVRTPQN